MRRTLFFSLGAAAALAAGLFVALERPALTSLLVASGEPPVLVVLVDDSAAVARIRASLDPRRVLVDTGSAIALAGGRIVTAGAEAASEPIARAGWRDRPIELLRVGRADRREGAPGATALPRGAPGADRIAGLMNEATLSAGEAMAVLRAMEGGAL